MTALVIEDDFDTAQAIADALRWEGFSVVRTARSAEHALETCDEVLPSVLLCDIRLPGMSGLELIAALQARHGAACPPAIVVSGFLPSDCGRIPGVIAALKKPCTLGTLRETVRRVVLPRLERTMQ